VEAREPDDTLRLGIVLRDIASGTRPVDGDPLHIEDAAVEQHVSNRMLIVELVVRVGVHQDAGACIGLLAGRGPEHADAGEQRQRGETVNELRCVQGRHEPP
jgi:hypothetical protein